MRQGKHQGGTIAYAFLCPKRKGYSLGLWLILGLIGGTAALVAALLMKEK